MRCALWPMRLRCHGAADVACEFNAPARLHRHSGVSSWQEAGFKKAPGLGCRSRLPAFWTLAYEPKCNIPGCGTRTRRWRPRPGPGRKPGPISQEAVYYQRPRVGPGLPAVQGFKPGPEFPNREQESCVPLFFDCQWGGGGGGVTADMVNPKSDGDGKRQ